MLIISIAKMGKGKTLFATNYALDFSKKQIQSKIIANYSLKLPNFIFTPFMFMNYSELKDALIIGDDFNHLKYLNQFTSIITSMSRKLNITIILTCQYYTNIPKKIRELADYFVKPKYKKASDELYLAFINQDGKIKMKVIRNAVKRVKDIYNTLEIVPFATNSNILKEVKKYSKTKEDLEVNLSLVYNQSQINRYFPELCEELNFKEE